MRSRLFTKKSNVGDLSLQRYKFQILFLGWLLPIFLTVPGYGSDYAVPDRRLWFYEQMGESLPLRPSGRSRAEVFFANSGELFSSQARGFVDFSLLELGLLAAQRFSPFNSLGSRDFINPPLSPPLDPPVEYLETRQTFGFEIARVFHAQSGGFYGRMGLQYLQFFPHTLRNVHLGITAGRKNEPNFPWVVQANINAFVPIPKESVYWIVKVEMLRVFDEENFLLGGFVGWADRSRGRQPGVVEYQFFSVGPMVDFSPGLGRFRLSLPVRLILDKERVRRDADPAHDVEEYPTEIHIDGSLAWSIFF